MNIQEIGNVGWIFFIVIEEVLGRENYIMIQRHEKSQKPQNEYSQVIEN